AWPDPPNHRRTKVSCSRCAPEFCATQRFCQTVNCPNSRMFWNVRAMPCATRTCGGEAEMSAPRNNTSPDVGANSPQIRLTIVLLPEPLGPMRPRIVPSGTVRSTPSTARTPPKCLDNDLSSSTGAFLDACDTAACSVDQPLERQRRAGI